MTRALFVTGACLLASATLAAPAPAPFSSGWSIPVNPSGDCKISRSGSSLTIEMPGAVHDYDPIGERFNAPRIVRDVEGDFDLSVRVRIDCRPSTKSTFKGLPSCVSAGFLLIYPETDRTSCIRLEYGLSQPGIEAAGYSVKPLLPNPRQEKASRKGIGEDGYAAIKDYFCMAQSSPNTWDRGSQKLSHMICDRGWKKWPFLKKTDSAYLRLEQRDKWISFFVSPDGEKWTVVEYQPRLPAKTKVGLAAFTTSSEACKVRFDQLKLTRIKMDK